MNETAVILNELAQGHRPVADGIAWFEALPSDWQYDVLWKLAAFCTQAGANSEDAAESIRRAGIRPTYTPAVLIAQGRLRGQLAKIVNLPEDERLKSFRLLVALLSIADGRRRTGSCAEGCSHEWHHLAHDQGTETVST